MPISSVVNRVTYQGDGTSAVFSFPYEFHAQADLGVFVYNSTLTLANMVATQTLNTNFTISGTADAQGIYQNGGNVVFNSTPNSQAQIVIFRSSVITNTFSISQNGPISSSGLNKELDYLTLIAQRYQDQAIRTVRLLDGFAPTFDPTIPANLKSQANKALIVNSNATGWTFDDLLSESYEQNQLLYSSDGSTADSLPGGVNGRVLMAHGSSAP